MKKKKKSLLLPEKSLLLEKLTLCRRDFYPTRETGFSPSFHEVALINYSLVSRARLFSLPLTRGPRGGIVDPGGLPGDRGSRSFFHREEEESAEGGWAQTLNGQVFTEGRPGRVLSYRHHHLFSMPISVAHAPVGPTARNPQRRGEDREREREREREAIQRKGRHFRLVEQPVTLFLRDNDELWL